MKGAKKIFYNHKKACPCLSSKWRNRWGVGGRTTGHFGTSVTGITHNRLCFPTRRRNWYCRQYKWSSWHKCYMIWVEENSDKRHGNSNRIPVLGKSTNTFDTYTIVTLKLRKLVRRCQSNVEFQLLWQQLLLKLFVKNFITSILPHKGGSDQEGPQPENHTPIISLLLKTYKRMALLVNSNNEEQRPQWRNCGRRLQSSWQIVLRRTFILKTVLQLSWIQATFPYTYSVKPTQLRHSTDQTSMSLQVLKVFSNSGKHLNPLTQGWNHS